MGVETPIALEARSPKKRQFLFGPLDWLDLCLVTKLGRAPLAVWLLLHLRWRIRTDGWVTLPNRRLAEMGVDSWAKRRALVALESEGLIRVRRNGKHSVQVALVREARR